MIISFMIRSRLSHFWQSLLLFCCSASFPRGLMTYLFSDFSKRHWPVFSRVPSHSCWGAYFDVSETYAPHSTPTLGIQSEVQERTGHSQADSDHNSEVAQLCPTRCNPMDCSPPGSSLHGILQARVLEWVAISFSRGSSRLRDRTRISCAAGRRFNLWVTSLTQLPPLTPSSQSFPNTKVRGLRLLQAA